MEFTKSEIDKLFGHEAADRENIGALARYFVPLEHFSAIKSDAPLRVLVGYKGTGKTALQKMAAKELSDEGIHCVWIRPDDVVELYEGITQQDDSLKLITLWKKGISRLVAARIVEETGITANADVEKAIQWAEQIGYRKQDFISGLAKKLDPLVKRYIDQAEGHEGLSEIGEHHILERLLKKNTVYLFIDDLDRVWRGDVSDLSRLDALLNALSDISSDIGGIRIRISLRVDVFSRWRNWSQASDHFRSDTLWIHWTNKEILLALSKRIYTYFGFNFGEPELAECLKGDFSRFLAPVFEQYFTGTDRWKGWHTDDVLLSLIRMRPRDLVLICQLAANEAHKEGATKISGKHFDNILNAYSAGCEADLVVEFKNELSEIKSLMQFIGPTTEEIHRKEGNKTYLFKTDELIEKIKHADSSLNLAMAANRKPSPLEIAHFLYMIGFITATRGTERVTWEESNALLTPAVGDRGYDWEVQPAYRAAVSVGRYVNWKDTIEVTRAS